MDLMCNSRKVCVYMCVYICVGVWGVWGVGAEPRTSSILADTPPLNCNSSPSKILISLEPL